MKRYVTLLLILTIGISALISCAGTPSPDSPETDKMDDISRLLELMSSEETELMTVNYFIETFRTVVPGVPDEYWDILSEELLATSLDDLFIPIYDTYYTHEDILGLIEFYETPVGRKSIEVQPDIMAETFVISQAWGEDIAQRILLQLEEDGYYSS